MAKKHETFFKNFNPFQNIEYLNFIKDAISLQLKSILCLSAILFYFLNFTDL